MPAQAGDISPDAVRRQLERMIVSDVFRGSPQLASFLHYVVEAVLQGRTDRIKGYTIGVEVLRRDTRFDPQVDPIVRVEAGRLRRAIARYYAGPGVGDELIIDMPVGSYVPVFRLQGARQAFASTTSTALVRLLPRISWKWGAAAAAILVVVTAGVLVHRATERSKVASLDPLTTGALAAGNGMPFLGVMRFETTGTPGERVVAATSLLEKLREGLSEFDAINVVPETPGGDPRVDYRLIGFIDHHDDGTATLRFRLIDVRSNNLVWTRAFNRLAAARDRAATEDSIVSEVANTLLPPYGVLRSYARGKSLAGGSGDTRYQCILWGSEAIRSYDLADYNRARSCLETATAKDLSFSDGFAYLAILYNREFIQGLEPGAGLGPPLDRALQTARRAVELKPNSARAYQALAGALFYRREFPASFAAFDKAMALNKYDSTIPIDYGGRLIAVGEVDRGMSLLRGAMKDGGEVRASWQRFSLFLGYYLKDDIAEATQQATLMANDTFLFGLAARTIAAVRNGNIDAARQTADRIIALRPAWRDDPGTELYRMIPNPAIVAKLTRDLAEAGVGRPKQGSGQ